MSEPVKRKIKVTNAEYVDEAESILIQGIYEQGLLRHQIHKDCFSYGDRSEEDIKAELIKTAEMMLGKEIVIVYDEDLDAKIEEKYPLKY